jgi:hypothetical protein
MNVQVRGSNPLGRASRYDGLVPCRNSAGRFTRCRVPARARAAGGRWIVRVKDRDPSRSGSDVYDSEEEMLRLLAGGIRTLIRRERDDYELDDDQIDALDMIDQDLSRERLRDAVDGWLEYQRMYDPDEQFEIEGPGWS